MFRLSTSNARFGIVLAALMLMLHSVASRLSPRSVLGRLNEGSTLVRRMVRPDTPQSCFKTDLKVDYPHYAELCEGTSAMKHPCFVHWFGDLKNVEVRPYYNPLNMTEELKIKNEEMRDFTIKDESEAFLITYLNAGGVQLLYKDHDPNTNCFNITLRRGWDSDYRIWVSDDDHNDDRDIDTDNVQATWKMFCNQKWIHIHAKGKLK